MNMQLFPLPWKQWSLAAMSVLMWMLFVPSAASAQTLTISGGVQTYPTLNNTAVTMTGKSELHVTGTGTPITGSTINLNSPDAWFWLDNIRPQTVASNFLAQIKVSGAAAVRGNNVRVVQYGLGTVVIPHSPAYQPLQAWSGPNFTGDSKQFSQYTYYNTASSLGVLNSSISSFKLKRGYMATVSTQTNGTGRSKVYVAQDGDIQVSILPTTLDNAIQFVRVFPWRWVSKKGSCDVGADTLNASWFYNWNNNQSSSLNWEYVPIRQQRWWPGLPTNQPDSTHLSGFNEPDNPVEDAYKTLDNGSVDTAISVWPELLSSGLRVGSPAVTDGGENWLYSFMDKANAANLRVDYVTIHFYRAGYSADQLYSWLKGIHDRTGRPLWVTEFNNGANWTGGADPTLAQNATAIGNFIDMMDKTPWIERYAVYSNVEDVRKMVDSSGNLTPAGTVYKNNDSPIGYVQETYPTTGARPLAHYPFDGDTLDASGYGNHGVAAGSPTYPTGQNGQAVQLEGTNSAIQLPENMGHSDAFSFAGWVYWDGGGNWQRIFDLGTGTSAYLFLTPSNGSKMRFGIKNGGAEQMVETNILPVGKWTHVALTLGANTAKLYINGTLAATNAAVTIKPSAISPTLNFLGKSQFPADPLFKGRLDDVIIGDFVFTPERIAALMTNTAPQFASPTIVRGPASRGAALSGTIAGTATDPDAGDTVSYSKISGPSWLSVAADGTLSGTLPLDATGPQDFVVRASDPKSASDSAVLTISLPDSFWKGDVSALWNADNNGNTNWATTAAGTIDTGQIPNANTNVIFTATGALNLPGTQLGADFSIGGLTVTSASSLNIGGTHNLTLGTGGLSLASGAGTTSINTSGQVILGAAQTWTNATSNALTVSSPIGGSGALTKAGTGPVVLTGNNIYSGGTNINSGTLQIGNGSTTGSIVGNVVNNGVLAFARSDDAAFAGTISGSGSLLKTGAGILTLGASNTYSAGTTIGSGGSAAVLRAAASNALGSGAVVLDPNGNGSTARLELSGGITLPNAIAFTARNNSSVGIQNVSGNNTISGLVALDVGGATYIVQSDAGSLSLSNPGTLTINTNKTLTLQGEGNGSITGVLVGSGSVAKAGAGTWTLLGANSYSGATTVSAGALALGASERLANTSAMTLAGGTFSTGGNNETLGALTLSADSSIDLGAGTSTLTYSGVGTFTTDKTLTITNWTSGSDHLFIGNTASLTPAQLAQIKFGSLAAQQLATGEVVPVSAPTTNTPPTIASITVTPANPTTNTTLTANVSATDAEGDTLSYAYVWKKNGSPLANETAQTLDLSKSGNGDKGDELVLAVTVSDGQGNSVGGTSASVTIGNTAPLANVVLSPTKPGTNSTLTATVTATDADSDTLTYSYVWKKNGSILAGETGPTLDLSKAGNGDDDDNLSLTVTASDGTNSTVATSSVIVSLLNRAPAVVSISPSSPSDSVGDTRAFTLTVTDADGVDDIKNVWFMANTVLDWGDGATLVYDRANNELFLRDGDHFNGPITPGEGSLSSGAATIQGSSVTLTRLPDGRGLTLSFALQVKNGLVGVNSIWGRVEDAAGTTDPQSPSGKFGFVERALWRVNGAMGTAQAPQAIVSPGGKGTSASLKAGSEFNLTLDLTDANGAGNLSSAYVLVNNPYQLGWANGFTLFYEARTNRLYLRSTDGNTFLGGNVVGQGTGTVENAAGSIRLDGCSATPLPNGVRLVIPVTLKSAFAGTKQVWSRVQDTNGNVAADSNANFGYKTEGTWVIGNGSPANSAKTLDPIKSTPTS